MINSLHLCICVFIFFHSSSSYHCSIVAVAEEVAWPHEASVPPFLQLQIAQTIRHQSMLSKMGMGDLAGMAGLGGMGGGKVNMGAMQANLDQRMKLEKTKERIRAKAGSNARAKAEQEARASAQMQERMQQPVISDAELFGLFGAAEKAERTPRGAKPPPQPQAQPQTQSSSGKKKKNGKK